jgi:hypothetical protein
MSDKIYLKHVKVNKFYVFISHNMVIPLLYEVHKI